MRKRKLIYAFAINSIAFAIITPLLAALVSGDITANFAGIVYLVVIARWLNCTNGGRWLLREWWRSTLRLEQIVLGENS